MATIQPNICSGPYWLIKPGRPQGIRRLSKQSGSQVVWEGMMAPEVVAAIVTGIFGAVISPLVMKWVGGAAAKRRKDARPVGAPPVPPRPQLFSSSMMLSIFGGLIGVFLGYFVIGRLLVSPCPPFSPTSVQINSPIEGAKIPRLITVQGSSCHVSKNDELWLFVVPEGVTAYYPQMGPILVSSDGNWSVSAYAGLEGETDIERGFVLIAAVADRQGSQVIRSYFSQSGPEYHGVEPLPLGVRLMHQVKVVRK